MAARKRRSLVAAQAIDIGRPPPWGRRLRARVSRFCLRRDRRVPPPARSES